MHSHLEKGLVSDEAVERKSIYGPCLINVPVPSVITLLLDGMFHPFFIFQIFSCILWMFEDYLIYAITILIMSVVSLVANLVQTRSTIKSVRELAHYECRIKVFRDHKWVETSSKELVPGDIAEISEDVSLPCDLLMLSGFSLVDESMLTGESQLVVKEFIPDSSSLYYRRDKTFTLFAGTLPKICRDQCIGMVIATGFLTAKGDLVRSILFPKPNRFSFYSDSFKFVGILAGIAVIGFIWASIFLVKAGENTETVLIRSLDLLTIVVPPVLPLVMTIGTSFSIFRLKQLNISCISLPAVNAAGRVSVVCFDKTGTITEDSMILKGAHTTELVPPDTTSFEFQENMCTCNSLTYIREEIQGDPQEYAIFISAKWGIVVDDYRWSVTNTVETSHCLQVYHFSSESKRMGVIVKNSSGLFLHMKGAPEVMKNLCNNIPDDYDQVLMKYTQEGYRVLACAYKPIDSFNPDDSLSMIEKDLIYLGMLILENPLKADSADTIRTLRSANIRCIISTGDAYLTGIAVAKICNVISGNLPLYIGELLLGKLRWKDPTGKYGFLPNKCCIAVTGEILEYMVNNRHPDLGKVVSKGAVFGRMYPHQKILLIQLLQIGDTMVAMVGDGANDCGALKMADVGLSLSKAEASIAAPFSTDDIKGIIHVLKEGRAALVTSLQSFKFVAMYSMIQFTCVCILYSLKNNLMDFQFLYQDLVIILPISVSMAYAGPYHMLSPVLPPGALFSVAILGSLAGQVIVQVLFQTIGYLLLLPFSWYEASGNGPEDPIENPENSTLFIIASFQLLIVGIVFNIGPPYRRATVENFWFTGATTFIILMTIYLLMVPEVIGDWFNVIDLEIEFKWIVVSFILLNLLAAYLWEKIFLPKIDDED